MSSFTLSPFSYMFNEYKRKITTPYTYALKKATEPKENRFLITNIFLNIAFLLLTPLAKFLDYANKIRDPKPFSLKLSILRIGSPIINLGIIFIAGYTIYNSNPVQGLINSPDQGVFDPRAYL